jgi:tetratricopeptide (TPR) repeat protein
MAAMEPTSETVWDHDPDLHALRAAFDQMVSSRQGRVVLVAGGPASGRTGLARALATRLRAHPAHPVVIAGGFRGDEWEPWPPPGSAWLDAFQAGVDLAGKVLELGGMLGHPGATAAAKLLGYLAGASSPVRTLLSRHVEGTPPPAGRTGPDLVREMLRVAAGPQLVIGWQPVVCVLDDLDRTPAAQDWWQGLVVRLAGELRDLPLLLVVTPDGPPVLGGHELGEPAGLWAARRLVEAGVGTWLPVSRLDLAAVTRWLWPCEPGLAERLWEVTGGEPSWLGELWEHWRATRVVRRDLPGQWVFGVPDHAALGKVHDLLWERLERCYQARLDDDQAERAMRSLAVGALEGREFTAQAVALVVGWDADELIDEFDEHLLVGPERPEGLLEEAGFIELADPRATTDGQGEKRWVARYRFVSELHWRTLRRYGLPGREHQDGCRALAAALQQALQPEPERAAAQIASLLREAGDHQAAMAWQIQADLGAAVPLVEARARLLLAQDTSGWDRFDHAQAARQLAHAAFLLWHDRLVGVALEVAQGWARAAQAANWPAEHARALYHCGLLHDRGKEPDAAIGCFRQARREAAAAGDLALATHAMGIRARVEMDQGRVQMARRRAEAARQLAHRHHAPGSEAPALAVLAALALRAGDGEGALAAAKEGAAAAEGTGDHQLLAMLLEALSDAQEKLGRVGQARETAARALEVARRPGGRVHEGWIELRLSRLWATDPPLAEGHLLRGLTIARQLDDPALEAHCRLRLAELAGGRGELRGARAELSQVTRLAHTLPLDALNLPSAVWQRWARLAHAQGVPGGQAALLWAVAAVHSERAGGAATSSLWEQAEQAVAKAGLPGGREGLAAQARSMLAHDGGWGLLEEVFGPLDIDAVTASDQAGSDG